MKKVPDLVKSAGDREATMLYSVDHHYGSAGLPTKVVLYGDIATEAFRRFHDKLMLLTDKGEVDYVHRPFTRVTIGDRSAGRLAPTTPVRLSGYGVELAIKSQEYKAQDDSKIKGCLPIKLKHFETLL